MTEEQELNGVESCLSMAKEMQAESQPSVVRRIVDGANDPLVQLQRRGSNIQSPERAGPLTPFLRHPSE